jgi:hypothetical protein
MDNAFQNTLILVVAVGAIAWLMKSFTRDETAARSPSDRGDRRAEEAMEVGEGLDDPAEREGDAASEAPVPVSAEGVAFVPRSHGILLLPLVEAEEETPSWLAQPLESGSMPFGVLHRLFFSDARAAKHRSGTALGAGDLTAARVTHGVSAADPWRLETLGRDGDFGFHPFVTRAGADQALELLQEHEIVQSPLDEDGNRIPPSLEDFEEARRRYERTEMELAIDTDEDEPPREGPWVSDRR